MTNVLPVFQNDFLRYADSIVKLYAVCAVLPPADTCQCSSCFAGSFSRGHGPHRHFIVNFPELFLGFSYPGWLLGDFPLHVFVLPAPGRALLQRHGLLSRAHPHAENPVIGGSRRVEKPLRRQRPEKMQLSDRRAKPCTSMNGPTWSAGACVDHC